MKRWNRLFVVALAIALGLSRVVYAAVGDPSMNSSNYSVNESEVGGNGCGAGTTFCSDSSSYSTDPAVDDAGTSLGETAAGNSSSSSYQSGAGFNTTEQPGLTFCVGTTESGGTGCPYYSGSSIQLDPSGGTGNGVLSLGQYSYNTAIFDVTDYTSYGYAITIIGTPPTYNSHPLAPMGTQSANSTGCSPSCDPSVGVEQFGINLRLNTTPGVGADPVQRPDSSFSFGVAGDGATGTYGVDRPYTISNKYRFYSGDTLASSPKTSGDTHFTISFLANMGPTTPSGRYSGSLVFVATGTY